jgi:hypothetical protein
MNTLIRLALLGLMLLLPAVALAQTGEIDLGSETIYNESLKALTILLVLAVLVENALAVLFNWRVFLSYFSLRGMRTIIMVAVSYLLVTLLGIDVIDALLKAYQENRPDAGPRFLTQALTALIVAGGSTGVHNVMFALGYRDSRREEEVDPKPPADKAWVAVRVRRVRAAGPVHVEITQDAAADIPAIAGTCLSARPGLLSLLMRNVNRFPSNGGHEVRPDTVYKIAVAGFDSAGNELRKEVSNGPVKFAAGAIVDFDTSL